MRRLIVAMLPILMGSSCFNVPGADPGTGQAGDPVISPSPGSPAPTFDLNGSWRYEASGGLSAGCITIANLRISVFDEGCDGTNLALVNTAPAYTYDSHAQVYCSYNVDPNDPSHYGLWEFSLDAQPDGTLKGMATLRLEPTGPITSGEVVWVRQ